MSATLLAAWAALSFQAAGNADTGLPWKTFKAPDGWFTVAFPGTPSVKKVPVKLPIGSIVPIAYTVDLGDNREFAVVDMAFPEAITRRFNEGILKNAFDGARRELLREIKGTMIAQHELLWRGHPGREVRVELPETTPGGSGQCWVRFVMVGNHFIQVAYHAPDAKFSTDDVAFFFDSFQVPAARGTQTKGFDWKMYGSDEGRFQVLLPGPPLLSQAPVDLLQGTTALVTQTVSRSPGYEFCVGYCDLPEGERPVSPEAALAAARERILRTAKGRLAAERSIDLGGIAGRELEIELPESRVRGGGTLLVRTFVSGGRVFHLSFQAPKASPYPEGRDFFMKSFKILPAS